MLSLQTTPPKNILKTTLDQHDANYLNESNIKDLRKHFIFYDGGKFAVSSLCRIKLNKLIK